jgi:hypothetical protein
VPTAGQLGWHFIARESAKDGYIRNPIIFDHQEVKLGLHIKIVEDEVNSTSRLRYDQPNTVHVVTIFLWVIW